MIVRFGAFALAAVLGTFACASAQQTPCVACAIGHAQSLQQVNNNQVQVRETLENQLNGQLQGQASSLQTQSLLRSLQLSGAMNNGTIDLQQILQQQQIELLQIEQQATNAYRKAHPPLKAPQAGKPAHRKP